MLKYGMSIVYNGIKCVKMTSIAIASKGTGIKCVKIRSSRYI